MLCNLTSGLVCWDLVSEPSTSGAYLQSEGKKITTTNFTKADKIYRALNDILKPQG